METEEGWDSMPADPKVFERHESGWMDDDPGQKESGEGREEIQPQSIEKVEAAISNSLMNAFIDSAILNMRATIRTSRTPVVDLIELPCSDNPTFPCNRIYVERLINKEGDGYLFVLWDGRFAGDGYTTRDTEDFSVLCNLMRQMTPEDKHQELKMHDNDEIARMYSEISKDKDRVSFCLGTRIAQDNINQQHMVLIVVCEDEIIALYLPWIPTMKKGLQISSLPILQEDTSKEPIFYFPIEVARFFTRTPKK